MTLRRYYFLALDSFFNFLSLTIPNLQTKDEERSVCKVRSQDPENFGLRGQVFGICLALLSSRCYSLGHSFIWEKSSTVWELMSAAVKE